MSKKPIDLGLPTKEMKGLEVPIVPMLHTTILEMIEHERGARLSMGDWHFCETEHCYAGWAVALAGAQGAQLERRVSVSTAADLIIKASCPWIKDDHGFIFYGSKPQALEFIKRQATREAREAETKRCG